MSALSGWGGGWRPKNRGRGLEMGWLFVGGIIGMVAVSAGAFGAHGLKHALSADMAVIFETGVRYQMYHALALLAVGLLQNQDATAYGNLAGWGFAVGIVVFSGSLYVMALSGQRWLGAITPVGGLALIGGWALLALAAWSKLSG